MRRPGLRSKPIPNAWQQCDFHGEQTPNLGRPRPLVFAIGLLSLPSCLTGERALWAGNDSLWR